MPAERIVALGDDNWWASGPTGPCGPCSELYFDRGPEHGCDRPDCAPGCECDRFLEYWNLVFMQYDRGADGSLTPLPKQNIDTGAGLERVAALLQGVHSVYETDTFRELISTVEGWSGARYENEGPEQKALRVLADHGRSMTMLAADGVMPSNESRGYILRRIIRRAVQHGSRIGLERPFLGRLQDLVVEQLGEFHPALVEHRDEVRRVLEAEEQRFAATLQTGSALLEDVIERTRARARRVDRRRRCLPPARHLRVPGRADRRARAGAGARDRRVGLRDADGRAARGVHAPPPARAVAPIPSGSRPSRATRASRASSSATARSTSRRSPARSRTSVTGVRARQARTRPRSTPRVAVRSPTTARSSGRVAARSSAPSTGTTATRCWRVRVESGELLPNMPVRAQVELATRVPTVANHTGTHLLHRALRGRLGDHVHQRGSAVRPDKLRFDFSHDAPLTDDELQAVEDEVNRVIAEDRAVRVFETTQDEARRLGAMMLFGEKYGEIVRLVEIDGYSRELCGGTHVPSTGVVGSFRLLSEGSVGQGVRRIEALTGPAASELLRRNDRAAEAAAKAARTTVEQLPTVVAELQARVRELEKAAQKGGGGSRTAASTCRRSPPARSSRASSACSRPRRRAAPAPTRCWRSPIG